MMKKQIFGIVLGVITALIINWFLFDFQPIPSFFLGMCFTFIWLIVYDKLVEILIIG